MKKKLLILSAFVCLLFAKSEVKSQVVGIKASIDTSNILIGDAINLTLSATYNPQYFQVQFPAPADTFNHFEVIEKGKVDTTIGREQNTYSQKIKITNFDSGVWVMPRFAFNIKPLQGNTPYVMYSDSLFVKVNTIAIDTSKPFKPIFGIRSAEMPVQQVILYIAGAVILLAIAAFLIYYFIKKQRERNKNKKIQEPEIKLPPHEKALQAFSALEALQLWQQGDEKGYQTELTDIMRTYLEEQFNIDCFEKTSSEIISQVKRIKALSTSRQQLRQLFETADMVKFAKSKPTAEQHIESLETAKSVILESYKKVKPIDEQLTS